MNWISRGALILSLTTLAACVSAGKMWPEQAGVVLDGDTRQPIEGAIVLARWIGTISQLVDSQTTCYHVESATTDAQGRYRIPAWAKMPGKVGHNEVQFTAYKAGYVHTRTDRATGDQYLRRDKRGVKERLEYLVRTSVECGDAGEGRRKLIPLYGALYNEADAIAIDSDDRKAVEILRFGLESIEIGSVEALDRMIERRKAK